MYIIKPFRHFRGKKKICKINGYARPGLVREQIQRDRGEKDKERAGDGGLLGQWSTQISGLTDTSGMPSQWLTRAILHSAVPPQKNNNPGRRKPPLTCFFIK